METRLALGLGRPEADVLLFGRPDGAPMSPEYLSGKWRRAVKVLKLPQVMFRALRHSHATALIASGLDVLTVSRRLGHGNPTVTLNLCPPVRERGCRQGNRSCFADDHGTVIGGLGTNWVPVLGFQPWCLMLSA
jgi:hypothetical protein